MFERFSERARRVLVLAQAEARQLDHGYVGTEHLLLGLIDEGEGAAFKALDSLGVTHSTARQEAEKPLVISAPAPSTSLPFTPGIKTVLELSLQLALHFGHSSISPEHLLLGLIREDEGGAQVLKRLGVHLPVVQQRVAEMMHATPPEEGMTPRRGIPPCSFCVREPPSEGRVIAGRGAVFICEQCLRWWAAEIGPPGADSPHKPSASDPG
jgi:ATP-dependent Clp protease ATP-binding subunit ClpC